MRFKAKLAPEQVSLLHSLIVPMSRLGNGGEGGGGGGAFTRNGTILFLDSDHVRLSCKGKSQDTDGIACFAELAATGYSSIFLDLRIESAAPNNAIVMELDLLQLRMAFKSVMGDTISKNGSSNDTSLLGVAALEAQYTVLKLAKRQNIPCLCIDACSAGSRGSAAMISVHHAIPVRILRHTEMQNHLPPQIPLPDVQLELSASAASLRTIVDRLKSISSTVYLEANMTGELTVSVHTDGASIQTFFSKLTPRYEDCKEPGSSSSNNKSTRVKIDTKKLCASLHWQQQQAQMVSSALLCLVENEMVVLHVNLNPGNVGFFTYYVPVHFLSSDPCDD
jgi:Hus1-like protein